VYMWAATRVLYTAFSPLANWQQAYYKLSANGVRCAVCTRCIT
jgi:hypothetical protein